MKMMRAAAVLVCASVLSLGVASAATISWTNDAGGSFSDVNNWQSGVVPAELDIALFTNTTDYSITLDVSVTNSEARFNAGSGSLDVDFAGSSWTLTNQLYVGQVAGSQANVLLHDGTFETRALSVGVSNNAAGSLSLAGIVGTVTATGGFAVGLSGTGSLTLAESSAGVRVLTAGGTGHAIGANAGSAGYVTLSNGFLSISGSLYVGKSGRGEMLLVNGTSTLSGALIGGNATNARSIVTLAGPGAELSSRGVTMGAAVGASSLTYLSNGLMRTYDETKWGDAGESLLVLNGGSLQATNVVSFTNVVCCGITNVVGSITNIENTITNLTTNVVANSVIYLPFGSGTGRLVMASADSQLIQYGPNSSVQLSNGTNGFGELILSNGFAEVGSIEIADGRSTRANMYVYNATCRVYRTGASALDVASDSYATGLLVVADSRALLMVTNGNGIVLGGQTGNVRSNGYGRLDLSNGTIVTRGFRMAYGRDSSADAVIQDGSLINVTDTGVTVAHGINSRATLILANPNSVLDATNTAAANPMILGNSTGAVGLVVLSNGTMKVNRLVIGNNGAGLLVVENQAVLSVNDNLYLPYDGGAGTGSGTGILVLASQDAVLNLSNGVLRVGAPWGGAKAGVGQVIISNGTANVKKIEVGQASDGVITLLNGSIMQTSTNFGDGLKIANSSEGGTGLVVLAHANAVINLPSNNLVMGNAANGTARLVISQGVVTVRAAVLGGLATQTNSYSEIVIEDGRLVTTFTDFQMGVSPLTRGLVLLKHANAQIIHTNGAVTLGNHSNTFSRLIMSNGYLYAASVQMANSSFTNRPGANGEWFIYNATNYLTASNSDSVVVAGKAGCTNLLVLAESGAVLEAPRNQSATWNTAYIANGGVGTLVMSNGLFRMGNFSVANGLGGVGTVYLENGRLEALNNVVIGNQGQAIVNVSGGLLIATNAGNGIDIGNGAGGSGTLNVSNGTVRTTFASTVGLGDGSTANLNVSGGEVDFSTTQFSLGWGTASVARLSVSGGSMTISQLVVVGGARATNCISTIELSGGTLGVARISASSALGASSNIWFSGGTLAALANLTNTLVTTLTNSPGLGLVTYDSSGNVILQSGLLTGPGGLAKAGVGRVNLTAINDYTGETRVDAGSLGLLGAGSVVGSSIITVSTGATLDVTARSDGNLNLGAAQALMGGGAVNGSVVNLGTVDPGQLIGPLTVTGNYDQSGGGTLSAQLSASGNDTLVVSSNAILGGTLDVTTLLYLPSAGNSYTVLTANTISGGFATTNLPFAPGGTWTVTYPGNTAVVLTVTSSAVPTPYELWAAGYGLTGTNLYDQADPDGDGYANLLEYAQGSDPTNSGSNVKIRMNLTNGAARLLIQRVNSATDIVYHVDAAYQVTNASWSTISSNVVGAWTGTATVDDNNTSAVHEVRIVDPVAAATNRFLRLRVERP